MNCQAFSADDNSLDAKEQIKRDEDKFSVKVKCQLNEKLDLGVDKVKPKGWFKYSLKID